MWIQLVGAAVGAAGSYLSAKKANQGTGGTPGWVQDNQRSLYNKADRLNYQTADFNQDQLNAMGMTREQVGKYNPYYDEMMANAQGYAKGVTADDISGFMNPYENEVIGAYLNDLEQMRNRADVRAGNEAEAAGAFGGDREAVYRAVTQGEYDRTGATTLADLRYRGYDSARDAAFRNHAQSMTGNRQLADLINQRTAYDYGDIDSLMNIGGMQYARDQAVLDDPMETLTWRSDINNAGSYQAPTRTGPYQDPYAAAIAGGQGGYRAGQRVYDYGRDKGWWGK